MLEESELHITQVNLEETQRLLEEYEREYGCEGEEGKDKICTKMEMEMKTEFSPLQLGWMKEEDERKKRETNNIVTGVPFPLGVINATGLNQLGQPPLIDTKPTQ